MEKLIESILRRIEADMNSPRIFEFLFLSLSLPDLSALDSSTMR